MFSQHTTGVVDDEADVDAGDDQLGGVCALEEVNVLPTPRHVGFRLEVLAVPKEENSLHITQSNQGGPTGLYSGNLSIKYVFG